MVFLVLQNALLDGLLGHRLLPKRRLKRKVKRLINTSLLLSLDRLGLCWSVQSSPIKSFSVENNVSSLTDHIVDLAQ